MLNVLRRGVRCFQIDAPTAHWRPDPDVVWIDLLNPTREEELAVEAALGVDLPTLKEMEALEPSSRLYQEAGSTFMTSTLLGHSGLNKPIATPVTFVLAKGLLVTLRYAELRAFSVFAERAPGSDVTSGTTALLGLLEAIVERLAEILNSAGDQVSAGSASIFERPQAGNFRPLLTSLAGAQAVTSLTRNTLVSLSRTLSFASLAPEISAEADCRAHLETLQHDVHSLTEHASYQSSQISFLLDAALGLINIEQNGIIKFFSVVAVVFMPPTLIASIYGMNFDVMPELKWMIGYPMSLVMMLVAAIVPVLWFKHRGWL